MSEVVDATALSMVILKVSSFHLKQEVLFKQQEC